MNYSLTSLGSTLRTCMRPSMLGAWAPVRHIASSAKQHADQPDRPDIGASSLFDNVKLEAEEAVTDSKEKAKDTTYQWASANFKASPRKLNMLARQIRNLPVDEAIKQMEFSPKRMAHKVLHNLAFARKNARDQKGFENLVVEQAWVGKGQYIKRIMPHGRGQFGIMHRKSAHIKFLFREQTETAKENNDRRNIRGWKQTKKTWTPLKEDKPIYNAKSFYNW